jgi:hypothetical protein
VPDTLFDALKEYANVGQPACARCGMPMSLRLRFAFGLGAGDTECTVAACFVPRQLEQWSDATGQGVTFYPFLVVLQRHGREAAVWLPYWHVVATGRSLTTKYGQWAPFMDEHLFRDLLAQARQSGYLAEPELRDVCPGDPDALEE